MELDEKPSGSDMSEATNPRGEEGEEEQLYDEIEEEEEEEEEDQMTI